MKKEDIIIEVSDKIIGKLSNLSYGHELNLKYLSFNKFVIRNNFDVDNTTFEAIKKISEKHRHIVPNLKDNEVDSIIKSISDDMLSGIDTNVKIVDKTLIIQSEPICFSVTFKDYIVPAGWMYLDNVDSFELNNMNNSLTSIIENDEEYQKSILLTLLQVLGVLIYLQLPNKIQFIRKSSRLEVINKSNKKKPKSNKKIYLYKTTYKISDEDAELDKHTSTSRRYNRKIDEWATRGHWRTLKDGRKIWIKECVKKSKILVDNNKDKALNNYKITKINI